VNLDAFVNLAWYEMTLALVYAQRNVHLNVDPMKNTTCAVHLVFQLVLIRIPFVKTVVSKDVFAKMDSFWVLTESAFLPQIAQEEIQHQQHLLLVAVKKGVPKPITQLFPRLLWQKL